jgi:hypothetical protein
VVHTRVLLEAVAGAWGGPISAAVLCQGPLVAPEWLRRLLGGKAAVDVALVGAARGRAWRGALRNVALLQALQRGARRVVFVEGGASVVRLRDGVVPGVKEREAVMVAGPGGGEEEAPRALIMAWGEGERPPLFDEALRCSTAEAELDEYAARLRVRSLSR